jgi:hypothetical protein
MRGLTAHANERGKKCLADRGPNPPPPPAFGRTIARYSKTIRLARSEDTKCASDLPGSNPDRDTNGTEIFLGSLSAARTMSGIVQKKSAIPK